MNKYLQKCFYAIGFFRTKNPRYRYHSTYKPIKPRTFAKKMDVADDQVRDLKKAIKRLIKRGQLMWGPRHLVMKPSSQPRDDQGVVGVFRRANAGFGFVTPADPDNPFDGDIYIPSG